MSTHEVRRNRKAVALQYGASSNAPVVVASGMGYVAERIVETAQENGVPVYEDNSLATMLTQLKLGQEIPPELYQAVVELYVYFLRFDPNARDKEQPAMAAPAPRQEETETEEAAAEDAAAETAQEPAPAGAEESR